MTATEGIIFWHGQTTSPSTISSIKTGFPITSVWIWGLMFHDHTTLNIRWRLTRLTDTPDGHGQLTKCVLWTQRAIQWCNTRNGNPYSSTWVLQYTRCVGCFLLITFPGRPVLTDDEQDGQISASHCTYTQEHRSVHSKRLAFSVLGSRKHYPRLGSNGWDSGVH